METSHSLPAPGYNCGPLARLEERLKPHAIRYLGVSLTPEVGANDALIGVRVVPAGRDGNKVFGRTLADGEPDSGEPVTFFPYAGEELHFPPGSVRIFLRDLDEGNLPGPDGYAPVSNTLWTWLIVAAPPDPTLFRFLFAAAQRLDTAHSLCVDVIGALTDRQEPFIKARQRLFGALGLAELMCVALWRTLDMLQTIPAQFSVPVTLSTAVTAAFPALREIRNAFEHIEDRALGKVSHKARPGRVVDLRSAGLDLQRSAPVRVLFSGHEIGRAPNAGGLTSCHPRGRYRDRRHSKDAQFSGELSLRTTRKLRTHPGTRVLLVGESGRLCVVGPRLQLARGGVHGCCRAARRWLTIMDWSPRSRTSNRRSRSPATT